MFSSKPDILIICFKPFAGRKRNGGGEVGARLAAMSSRVKRVVFEVVWADLRQRVHAAVTEGRYRWVVVLGEGYTEAIVVERIARKTVAFPDEHDKRSDPLPPELPSLYVSDLAWPGSSKGPGKRLPPRGRLGLQYPNFGVMQGVSAGVYLCNGTFYYACTARDALPEDARPFVGLVHLPPQEEWESRNRGGYVAGMARVVCVILARNGVRL